MIYRYDAYVDLPDDEAALAALERLHLALCGGAVTVDDSGMTVHECVRPWEIRISESRPVSPPEPEGEAVMPQEVADALLPDLNVITDV